MRSVLLFLVALLKIGTLKTEPIDISQSNGRMDLTYPMNQGRIRAAAMYPAGNHLVNNEKLRELDEVGLQFQPNDTPSRKDDNFDENEDYENEAIESPEDQFKSIDQLNDAQSTRLSNYLMRFLQRPGIWEAPVIMLRDTQDNLENRVLPLEVGNRDISKRSRYYRRYPWKRQNSSRSYGLHADYEPYCNPSKNDVVQLLKALHDARQGNKSRLIHFCNRRRPAGAVYTNIRFLGRRRK